MLTSQDVAGVEGKYGRSRYGWLLAVLAVLIHVGLATSLFLWCLGFGSLTTVDPSTGGYGLVYRRDRGYGAWAALTVAIAFLIVLSAYLPPWGEGGSRRRRLYGQAIAGVGSFVSSWLGLTIISAFFFAGPGERCQVPSCWPMREQAFAVAIPIIATGLVMIGMAVFGRGLPLSVRAWVPAVAWLALVVIQGLVWDSTFLAWFMDGL